MMPGNRRSWKICFVTPGHTAIEDTKMTKKFITDEEDTDRPLPRNLLRLIVEAVEEFFLSG